MAAFVKVAANNQQTTASTSITATVVTGGVPVGNTLVVGVTGNGVGTVVSATDTRGNTYTIDRNSTATTGGQVLHTTVTTALLAGDTITVTGDTSIADRSMIAAEFSGVTDFDQVVSGSGTGTAVDSGATPTTTQADELVVGFIGISSSAATLTASDATYTLIGSTGVGQSRQVHMFYKTVSAVGTQAITGTISVSAGWRGTVATYTATAVPSAGAFDDATFSSVAFDAVVPTTTVTATRSSTWGSLGAVTATQPSTWATTGTVEAAQGTTWDTLTPATDTHNTSWQVTTPVTATRGTTWAVAASFTDDFNRADGPLGANWATAGAGPPTVAGNRVVGGTTAAAARWTTAAAAGPVFAQATYQAGGLFVGVSVALPGYTSGSTLTSGGTWYTFRQEGSGGGIRIAQKDLSASTHTGLVSSTRNLVGGDVIRLEYDGTILTALINGAVVLTHTPASPLSLATQRYVGFAHGSSAQVGLPLLDDWAGGNTTVAPTTTSVTASVSTSWGVAAPVTTSRATTWDTPATVTATRGTTWAVTATTTGNRPTTWSTRSTVTGTHAATWATRATVTPTRVTTWQARATAATTRTTTWGARTTVTTAHATTWETRSPVTDTHAATWDSLAPATSSHDATWATLTPVTDTRTAVWDITTATVTIRTATGSFASYVTTFYANEVSTTGAGLYIIPTTDDETTLGLAWSDIMNGAYTSAAARADTLNFEVVQYTDTDNNRVYYMLRERTVTRYWGLYVWNPTAASPVVYYAPHPRADVATHDEARKLFQQDNARQYFLSGSHRNDITTTDPDGDNWSDVANADHSVFKELSDRSATRPDIDTAVQVHGFANASYPAADIVLSSGSATYGQVYLGQLRDAIQTDTGLTVHVYDGTLGTGLTATASATLPAWRTAGKQIVHMEQNSTVRTTAATQDAVVAAVVAWTGQTQVSSTRGTTWAALARAASNRASTWATQTSVTGTHATTWATGQRVTGTRATSWGVAGALFTVTATHATTWSTRSFAVTTHTASWTVRTPVAPVTRGTTWAILTPTSTARASTWTTRAPVTTARVTTWTTRTRLATSKPATWNTLTRLTAAHAATWLVGTTVTSTRDTLWAQLEVEGPIGRIVSVRWRIPETTSRLRVPEAGGHMAILEAIGATR